MGQPPGCPTPCVCVCVVGYFLPPPPSLCFCLAKTLFIQQRPWTWHWYNTAIDPIESCPSLLLWSRASGDVGDDTRGIHDPPVRGN
jgi:hypothetical protein